MIFVFHHFPCWEVPKSAPEKAVPEEVGMAKGAVPRSFLVASLATSALPQPDALTLLLGSKNT